MSIILQRFRDMAALDLNDQPQGDGVRCTFQTTFVVGPTHIACNPFLPARSAQERALAVNIEECQHQHDDDKAIDPLMTRRTSGRPANQPNLRRPRKFRTAAKL